MLSNVLNNLTLILQVKILGGCLNQKVFSVPETEYLPAFYISEIAGHIR